MLNKKFHKLILLSLSVLLFISFAFTYAAQAQEFWTSLPPYNTLWPLWSPALSPVDNVTGLPVPIVTSLEPSTVLPVQPGITWNPALGYPWLLYNTPVGLSYFDPLYGINFWPPASLVDSTGAALPLALPDQYGILPPTDPLWLQQNVLFANSYFLQAYPSLLASADPALLLGAINVPLAPPTIAAITAGIPIPGLGTTILPPPGILSFLTPAAILGW
ncbi:hypothetical protein JXL19_08030 [bacterium]|nr:hypothetical protein [bacterium]